MKQAGRQVAERERQRLQYKQDLKYCAWIVIGVAVASLVFYPYARDIWGSFLILVGLLIVALCWLRRYQVFGLFYTPRARDFWETAGSSGWWWTFLWYLIGLGLIALGVFLSQRLRAFFPGLPEWV